MRTRLAPVHAGATRQICQNGDEASWSASTRSTLRRAHSWILGHVCSPCPIMISPRAEFDILRQVYRSCYRSERPQAQQSRKPSSDSSCESYYYYLIAGFLFSRQEAQARLPGIYYSWNGGRKSGSRVWAEVCAGESYEAEAVCAGESWWH